MISSVRVRCAALTAAVTALAGCVVIGLSPIAAQAATIPDIQGPAGTADFGGQVLVLSNGNYVVVDKFFDNGPNVDAGAVFLRTANNTVITRVTGATSGDQIGSEGVVEVGTSDFVVLSGSWHNGSAAVGAATWVDGTTGLAGTVNAGNSLVGTANGDFAGTAVTALTNGDYVVTNPMWGASDVGAVTWADGSVALHASITTGNSIIGAAPGDNVGSGGVTPLSNGNYVVSSPSWDNGATVDAGAVTWATGKAATQASVSTANSLFGTTTADGVGSGNPDTAALGGAVPGVTALSNGNFVVSSPFWDNGATVDAGAVTWANGSSVAAGPVSTANSIFGTTTGDNVGRGGVAALNNGNYVVNSPLWNDTPILGAGAVTWANGSAATAAAVASTNSIVGTTSFDNVGAGGVTALTNGNYAVSSPFWSGGVVEVGAVTWADGSALTSDTVTGANSLVGAALQDHVGFGGVTALTNGNYVVSSPFWDSSVLVQDVGAVTWADGTAPTSDVVGVGNSLIGNTPDDLNLRRPDQVGSGGVTALTDGNYVVSSPFWTGGGHDNEGAVTWADGAAPTTVSVSETNSLHGSVLQDNVGSGGVTALAGGRYVVSSPLWNNGGADALVHPGAATFGPALGLTGAITVSIPTANSALGTAPPTFGQVLRADGRLTADDQVLVATGQNRVLRLDGLVDFQPPTIVQPDITAVSALPQSVTFAPTAFDNKSVASVLCTPESGSSFPLGATTVSCTATDTAVPANSTTKTFTVTVVAPDVVAPLLTVPTDISVGTAPGLSTRAVSFLVTATDNVGIQSTACDHAPGSVFPLGTTTVTCTATDLSGNAISHSFAVTVVDHEAPLLVNMLGDMTISATPGAATRVVTFTTPTATDNVGVQSVGCNPATGSSFPIGVTTVTCTATDAAANIDSHTFTVTVVALPDTEKPQLGDMPDDITVSAAPGATTQPVTYTMPTATDNSGFASVSCTVASGSSFPIGVTTVTCTATDASANAASRTFKVTVKATAVVGPSGNDFVSLSGARLADTRPGSTTVDSKFAGQGIRGAGSTLELTVAGRGGVDPSAAAVALNVTAVGATDNGFVTVFPCGSAQPTASNLNYTTGSVVPNAVIAKIGTGGAVCLFVSAATHLVVDVNGYFPPTSSLQSLNPARVLETRDGLPTIDAQQQGVGIRAGGSTTAVKITGRATVPNDATAVVLNVTITEAQGPGFATVFPCGSPIPTASNINYVTGSTIANMVVSKIGDGGSVCVFTNQGTHLVVDVAGYFPVGTSYHSLVPARLLDTRSGTTTIDGQFAGGGRREAGEVEDLTVVGRGGVTAPAATVVLNVTVTEPTAAGFVTVYPCGIPTPLASNLNYEPGMTVANAVVVKVGTDGKVCLFNSSPTQLVVDVNGYFPG